MMQAGGRRTGAAGLRAGAALKAGSVHRSATARDAPVPAERDRPELDCTRRPVSAGTATGARFAHWLQAAFDPACQQGRALR